MLVQVICGINTFSLLAAGPFYQDTKTDANFGTDILRTYSGVSAFSRTIVSC